MGVVFDQELDGSHRRVDQSAAAGAAGPPAALAEGRAERTVAAAMARADEAVRLLAEAALLVAPDGSTTVADTHLATLLRRLDSLTAVLRAVETQSKDPGSRRLVWVTGPNAPLLHAVDPRIGSSACGLVGFPAIDPGVWQSGPRCFECARGAR
jgi:hypothetical protein